MGKKLTEEQQKQILEAGSHEELLAKKGLYYQLYTAQAQDQGVAVPT